MQWKGLKRVAGLVIIAGLAAPSLAATSNPFQLFNVYSLEDIGTNSSVYSGSIDGVIGASGNVYFGSISATGNGSTTGYGMYVGGNATLSGSYGKSIQVGGNVTTSSIVVYGNVVAGGNIKNANNTGGTIYGNAVAGSNVNLSNNVTVTGQKQSHVAYTPGIDFSATSGYFLTKSADLAAKPATGTVTDNYGNLTFNGVSGLNIIYLDALVLKNAWGFTINAPSDATVVVNVMNTTVTLDSTNWVYQGGLTGSKVLLNMANATTLNLSGANAVNILAPKANTTFTSGQVQGSLVVGKLTGGGQILNGEFTGNVDAVQTPEPATAAFLMTGLMAVLYRRQSRKKVA